MTSSDVEKTILRNMLLGRWAAEKLGMADRDADAYSDALARSALVSEGRDVFTKIRKDFDDARSNHDSAQAALDSARANVKQAEINLGYTLVTAPIGATKPHHLPEAVDAIELKLTDEEVQHLEAPYRQYGPSWF